MKHPFVVFRDNDLGRGKLVFRDVDAGVIGYFRSPAESTPIGGGLPLSGLRKYTLYSETRVYFENPTNFSWQIGRVLGYQKDYGQDSVGFPNDERQLIQSAQISVLSISPAKISDLTCQ